MIDTALKTIGRAIFTIVDILLLWGSSFGKVTLCDYFVFTGRMVIVKANWFEMKMGVDYGKNYFYSFKREAGEKVEI